MTTDHLCPLPSPSHQNTVSDTHLSEPIGSVVARLPWVRDAVVPSPAPAPTPSSVLASTLSPAESPLAVLFTAFGHDAACLAAARSGQNFGCHCEGKRSDTGASAAVATHSAQEGGCKSFAAVGSGHDDNETAAYPADDEAPADGPIDPSLVAGLTLRYGHMLKGRGLFLPRGLGLALADLVATGDPTAQIIWGWCLEHNLIGGDVSASTELVSESKAKPEPDPAPPPPSPTLRLVTTAAVRP